MSLEGWILQFCEWQGIWFSTFFYAWDPFCNIKPHIIRVDSWGQIKYRWILGYLTINFEATAYEARPRLWGLHSLPSAPFPEHRVAWGTPCAGGSPLCGHCPWCYSKPWADPSDSASSNFYLLGPALFHNRQHNSQHKLATVSFTQQLSITTLTSRKDWQLTRVHKSQPNSIYQEKEKKKKSSQEISFQTHPISGPSLCCRHPTNVALGFPAVSFQGGPLAGSTFPRTSIMNLEWAPWSLTEKPTRMSGATSIESSV